MTIYLCQEFIRDLVDHGDANFASRVLSKVINSRGEFESNPDDHPYDGIDGAWIRYVSAKRSAYRAIFVKRGSDVYWYRAGEHSVEDNLSKPSKLDSAVPIGSAPAGAEALADYQHPRYVKSTQPRLLREVLSSRIPIPHREITLVSPNITLDLTHPNELLGRLIQSVIDNGGNVTAITSPPPPKSVWMYRTLASRGVELLIHPNLNARLYIFEVDKNNRQPEFDHHASAALIGSAELTRAGLNVGELPVPSKEELCYEIDSSDIDGALHFSLHLLDGSEDLETHLRLETERSLGR
ncbi:hypothetical protein RMR10_001450 [Agrobacterium rosae]|uniref:hypothetical protein n=1 Tax=Agrobacterium rosae TaxID=1972867 RepID=UPI002A11E0FD|nr:hypothetical protein [Agrobacterium rosae]MDX8314464.1 hypothetical protein [Agrobacterium rosae]